SSSCATDTRRLDCPSASKSGGSKAGTEIRVETLAKSPPHFPRERVTIAGNFNEAIELLVEDMEVTKLQEDDLLALVNVGGYGLAAASNHRLRGAYREFLLMAERRR
ncbi:MAG: hypothetical protein ACRETY_10720, partial [Steroidobacteraceae bacterium]